MRTKGQQKTVLIFGGAGFIGSNWAGRLLCETDANVHIYDNLSRYGSQHNLEWLKGLPAASSRLSITIDDVRNAEAVRNAARDCDEIYHLAAQVAVTSSVEDPLHDFAVNLQGTFNVLEAARQSRNFPFVLFTSTNKVYGDMKMKAARGAKRRVASRRTEVPLAFTVKSVVGSLAAQSWEGCAAV